MQLKLGEKIRELRRRDGVTQEVLADKLGVTPQAVSRWEMNSSYPDTEIIPPIANFFGITIDELFGYDGEREAKIDELLSRVDALGIPYRSDDDSIDECLQMLRVGLAEFPANERIMKKLADILNHAGWRRHGEWSWSGYGEDGHIRHDYDCAQENEYWAEAIRLYESLALGAKDPDIAANSVKSLVLLYRSIGEYDRAVACAKRMPKLSCSREMLLAASSDGTDEARYIGELLLTMVSKFAEQCVYGLVNNKNFFDTDMPMTKVSGLIDMFGFVCDDGNLGVHHSDVRDLYLYLARLQWERGYQDESFLSLDRALEHARLFDALHDDADAHYTAPLVEYVRCDLSRIMTSELSSVRKLPEDFPVWCNPDPSEVLCEIKADPRWDAWVKKTRE